MKLTQEAISLIKTFEGFRSHAYRDAAGILTIGYGHTAMAGPPAVTPNSQVSVSEAERMLHADIDRFVEGLKPLIKHPISDRQFSALVSFAYNVGLSNVARSSVLSAVNAGDMEAVPRRLALWVKAAGRTCPGLVRRRAAEAAMFAAGGEGQQVPDFPRHKPMTRSKTLWSALVVALAAVGQSLTSTAHTLGWLLLAVLVAAVIIIIRERLKKLKLEGI